LRDLILEYCVTSRLDGEGFALELEMLRQVHGNLAPAMLNLLDSHDTPRILTVLRGDVDRLLVAVAFLITYVGMPLVYYGDEVGLCGDMDPDCRRTMEWDETQWNHRIHDTYRRLIALRRAHPALRRGHLETLLTFDGVYAYRRVYEGDEVIVILNTRSAVTDLAIPTGSHRSVWQELGTGQERTATNGILLFDRVPAVSFTILLPGATKV